MEFAVLGPVAAWVDGTPVSPGTRKEHQLIALLLVHVNQTVTLEQIAEALWGDDAPAKPAVSVRSYVSNIRRALSIGDDDPKTVLITESGGYRLSAERVRVDACRLEDVVGEIVPGDSGLDAGEQAARLDAVLDDVRGEPFADFVYDEFVEVEAARLTELVLVARERRCELAVELGDSAAWLPTISALAAVHPLRERLRGTHMRALVDTGRHGEALRAFADHRARMIDEMGIEPGPELRALEQEILALDELELVPPDDSSSGEHAPAGDVERSQTGPAERRQLTTIAIVGRPGAIGSADPEDVGEAVAAARRRWRAIVEAHGAITEEIPDGVLAHVGYPAARERDAERAVRAALSVVAHDPQVVVGVATGPVLAEPGPDGVTFAGDAPAIATRLAFTGPAGSVVVGDRTRMLAAGQIRFGTEDGLTIATGVEAASGRTSGRDLLGREEELALARRMVAEARAGHGRVLVVTGEAGMGKTAFVDRLASDYGDAAMRFVGSPFHSDTAFWPVMGALEEHPELAVPEILTEMGGADDSLAAIAADPAERRSILLDAAIDAVVGDAATQPMMCLFDDVHSMDASTRELIEALIDVAPQTALLVVVAIRGGDTMGLADVAHAAVVGLGPLADTAARALIDDVAGGPSADEVRDVIVERAGGVPLFIEELTRALSATPMAEPAIGPGAPIPETLHDLLMARLDAVPEARSTVHLAAVAGDGFTNGLLATVGDVEPARVDADIAALCDAGILARVRRRGEARYRFRHGLILETAYEAVPRPRRAELHGRIAATLLAQDPDLRYTAAEVLARHHEAAGDLAESLKAWRRAADRSLSVSALAEASEAVRRGLAVADRLDESLRADVAETVVDLWLARGVVLAQQSGPGSEESMAVYEHLLDELDDHLSGAQRFRALWGRWYSLSTGWDTPAALTAAAEVYRAAIDSGDTALLIEGHHVMWATLLTAGEFEPALQHTREARSLYDAEAHHWLTYAFGGHDPGVCMHSIAGLTSWILGDPEAARPELAAATRLGDEIGHPYSRLEASFGSVAVAVLDGDVALLRSEADTLEGFADGGALPVGARGYIDGCRGVASVTDGELAEGLATLESAAGSWADLWGAYCLPFDTELAAALVAGGRPDQALARLDSILDRESRGRWWDSEVRRVRAEVLAAGGEHELAAAELQRATEIARDQAAVVLEARAEASLEAISRPSAG